MIKLLILLCNLKQSAADGCDYHLLQTVSVGAYLMYELTAACVTAAPPGLIASRRAVYGTVEM